VKIINLSTKGGSFPMVLDPTLNGENMQFWLTFFIGFVFAHFYPFGMKKISVQQLKAWSFRMWKNLVHTQSNSDTIARWSSITFFLYTLYHSSNCGAYFEVIFQIRLWGLDFQVRSIWLSLRRSRGLDQNART
jgi:hypothetical protein